MDNSQVFNQILKYNGIQPNDRQILRNMYETNSIDIKMIKTIIDRSIWNYPNDHEILGQLIYHNYIDPASASSPSRVTSKILSSLPVLKPTKRWRLVNDAIHLNSYSDTKMKTVLTAHLIPFTFTMDNNHSKPGHVLNDLYGRHAIDWDIWRNEIFAKTNPYWDTVNGMVTDEAMDDYKYKLVGGDFMLALIENVKLIYIEQYKDNTKWNGMHIPHINPNDGFWDDDPIFYQKVYITQPNANVLIIGDIHSSFHSLSDIINENRHLFNGKTMNLKPENYIIFLGDIIDRGPYSIELLVLIFYLKINNPEQVYIINGNHEDFITHSVENPNLLHEAELQFGPGHPAIGAISRVLYYLPSTLFLNYNGEWYHLSHGAFDIHAGITTNILHDWLNNATQYIVAEDDDYPNDVYVNHNTKWGDFDQLYRGYLFYANDQRNVFGYMVTKRYLEKNNIKCIIRGHQDVHPLSILIDPKHDSSYDAWMNDPATVNGVHNDDYGSDDLSYQMDAQYFPPSLIRSGVMFYLRKLVVPDNPVHPELLYLPVLDKVGKVPVRIPMDPGRDFLVITTSTAVVSRYLQCNAYILLSSKASGN